ncbi:hypothetical protein [Paraliomyxa miuraensis]|uniref:hypothetical protein n=1 Tax=Paraliomyxa miuraensis TaxID=376150 RepID=UPI00224D7111|nr:hypothetical protein [Paraliomyxa miuraensis]MCX4242550.1 hypothetical protein [Paraliomyxa miuraensis]
MLQFSGVLVLALGASFMGGEPASSDGEVPPVAASEPAAASRAEPSGGEPDAEAPEVDPDAPASPDEGGESSSGAAAPLYTHDPMVSIPSPAIDDEVAPSAPSDVASPADEFERRGFFITLGAGLTHCAQDFCSAIPMGGLGRLELGYRLTRLALVATVTGGGGLTNDDDAAETSIRTLDAAAGLLLLPVREGPVDPFIGASLGYARTVRVLDEASSTDRQYSSRGALRLSGGILWHVTRRAALGPRFDVQMPFAGKWCTRFDSDFDPEPQCPSIREDIIVVDDPDKSNESKRSDRRAFPRPWALTLDLRIAF